MSDEKNMESLEELFKCAICCDSFTEPRSLPCSHIFCLGCLQRAEESEPTKFIKTCCICRQEIHPKRKASTFPHAFLVQQMVERVRRIKAASNQDDRHRMVDQIFNLFETRKQLKKEEESHAKQNIVAKKEEITKGVDEAVEKIKQYVDSQRQIFLDSINAECEKRLEKLNQYSQEADKDCKVKSWVISNIDDNFTMVTPPKPVLPASLALESEGNRAVDAFLNSLDLNSIRRYLSDDSQDERFKETNGWSFRPNDGDTQNERNDTAEEPEEGLDHNESADSRFEYLRSAESDTSRINIPVDSTVFPPDISRSDSNDGNTLTSESFQKDPNNVVSVTRYIVGNRYISGDTLEDSGASGSDYSSAEGADVFPVAAADAYAVTSVSAVNIEHWGKASSHESRGPVAGDQRPGLSHQRGRLSSAPSNGSGSSKSTKASVWRVRSSGPTNKNATGMWKSFKGPMVLRTTVVQDIAPSKRIYVHVTSNYTTIAVEEGTKMWVFMNAGLHARRKFILDAVSEEETQPAIIGIASLPNDNGWCMLLKNTILVFNYHGVLSLRRSFPDTHFLSAFVHRSDQLVFVDKDFNIGLAGFSRDNFDEVQFLRPSGLKLTGVILAMATGPNMLFIAHADPERNVGTISCLSGLGLDSLVLSHDHAIHAPHGFHCPQSICCNKNGKLFALWRDRYFRRSVIVEYLIDGDKVISNVAFDEADRVRVITCSSEGRLVTCSV